MFAREELEGVLVNALNQPLGILFARACYHGEECDDGAKILYAIKQMDLDMLYTYLRDTMCYVRVCDASGVRNDMRCYAEKIEADDVDNDSCAIPKVWNEKVAFVGFFERQRVDDDDYFATEGYRFYISETGRLLVAHEYSCAEYGEKGSDLPIVHVLTYSQPSDCCDKFMLNEVTVCMSEEQKKYWREG